VGRGQGNRPNGRDGAVSASAGMSTVSDMRSQTRRPGTGSPALPVAGSDTVAGEIAGLRARIDSLRDVAEMPDAELGPAMDAVLGELEFAVGLLGKLRQGVSAPEAEGTGAAEAERRLLRAVFQEVPAPIFLLERDFSIRRVNKQALALLGADAGSTTGTPFTALVEPATAASVRAQLTAVLQTGRPHRVRCQLLGAEKIGTTLSFDLLRRPGESGPLIMAVAGPANMRQQQAVTEYPTLAGRSVTADRVIAETTQRLDLISAASRLLFENAAFGESLMLRRCASLLAAGLSAWVIVDVEKQGEMRRLFVAGPAGERFADLTRAIEDEGPLPGSLPWEVHTSGRSRLIAEAEEPAVLGGASSGVPVLTLLGATSVLCTPLADGERGYGTLTLARRPEAGPFAAADLVLLDEVGQQLAVAIKVGRMFLRRSAIGEALQASLLPRELPPVPGVEIATAYAASTQHLGLGGDFYDVYPGPGGWGLMIGDVCGRGEAAGAVTALARYAIRVLAHWNPEPGEVLRLVNEVMNNQQGNNQQGADRFVTAIAARFGWHEGILRVVLASAGHPGPLLVRPDGRVRVLRGGGLPLGFFDDARPATERLDLEPGDMVFFYSDGVTEARGADGGYFESRFADELAALAGRPASEVVASIRELVLEFSEGEVRDDVTLVALRALEPPTHPAAHLRPDAIPGHANQQDEPAHGTDQL
jgi:serine phosphatase RsbU (regulator of sigma subunit)/GAF domain-containing protein